MSTYTEVAPCPSCGVDMDDRKQMCNRCWFARTLQEKVSWYKTGGSSRYRNRRYHRVMA